MEIKLITGLTAFEAAKNTIRQIDLLQQDVTHLVVVPDAFSMQAEALIFDVLGITSTFNIQVVGISRLASKILRQNGIAFNRISALEEVFAVYCAVRECEEQAKFVYFKKCGVELCQKILQIIKQFKACRVRPQQIKPVGDENLDAKMADLRLIYEKYEAFLGEKLDLSRLLEFFVEKTERTIDLKKVNLYFVNFDSFSVEINSFICRLAKQVGKVFIGYAKPSTAQKNAYIYDNDIFKKTTALAKENGVNVLVENFEPSLSGANLLIAQNLFALRISDQNTSKNVKHFVQNTAQNSAQNSVPPVENFKNFENIVEKSAEDLENSAENLEKSDKNAENSVQNAVEKKFAKNSVENFAEDEEFNFVNLQARNPQEEAEFVAKFIKRQVFAGAKFKDFAVAVSDKKYFDLLKNTFQAYQIAAYADDAASLDQTILGRFLLKCLQVAKLGFDMQTFQFFASSPLLNASGLDQETLSAIAYYVVDEKAEFLQRFAKYRPVVDAIDQLAQCSTCKSFSFALQKIMEIVQENYENLLQKLQNPRFYKKESENRQSFTMILNVLQKLSALGADEKFSIADFEKLFQISLLSVKVETVPTYVDAVFVGDATTSYYCDVKTLFVLGATASALPKSQSDTGLIDDQEIKKLSLSFVLEPEIRVLNRRCRLKLFELLQHAKQNLIVLQPLSQDGQTTQRASFVDDLFKIFGGKPMRISALEEFDLAQDTQNDQLDILLFAIGCKQNLMPYFSKMQGALPREYESSVQAAIEQNLPQIQEKQNINPSFLPQKQAISPSELETYFTCPNKRFFSYVLGLKELENIIPTRRQFGTFQHAVLQSFAQQFAHQIGTVSQQQMQMFLEKNFALIAKDKYDEKILNNKFFVRYLKKESEIILKNAIMEQKFSQFKPFLLEEKVWGQISQQTKLVGKVDRVDKYQNYFRVIDYKTGKVSGIKNALYHGRRLQLFLYADAIAERTGLTCAGVYYFDCQTEYSKPGVAHKIFNGLTLRDNEVVLATDSRLDEEGVKSSILGASRLKKPKNEFVFSSTGMETSLQEQIKYAKQISKIALDEMGEGYMEAKPCAGACAFCPYISVCRHTLAQGFRKNLKAEKGEEENLG